MCHDEPAIAAQPPAYSHGRPCSAAYSNELLAPWPLRDAALARDQYQSCVPGILFCGLHHVNLAHVPQTCSATRTLRYCSRITHAFAPGHYPRPVSPPGPLLRMGRHPPGQSHLRAPCQHLVHLKTCLCFIFLSTAAQPVTSPWAQASIYTLLGSARCWGMFAIIG